MSSLFLKGEVACRKIIVLKKFLVSLSTWRIASSDCDISVESFVGGKIIGAGGGGFFLMVSSNMKKSISYLKKKKLYFLNFSFDNLGSRIIEKY